MTRVTYSRIAFVVLLVALLLLSHRAVMSGPQVTIPVALLMAAPGLLQGVLLRDLYRGRRALEAGEHELGVSYTLRFLETLRRRPWLRLAIGLRWWTFTPCVEAMALNNLGAARMQLGDIDAADHAFSEAVRIDPKYAIPWVNRSVLAFIRGQPEKAAEALAEARRRGYSGGTLDRLSHQAGALLARIEGSGGSAGAPHA